MSYKIKKLLSIIVLFIFLLGRVNYPLFVLAQEITPPSSPPAPNVPVNNTASPQPPSPPANPPSSPQIPIAPSAPSLSAPTNNVSIPSTSVPMPSSPSLPSEAPLSTDGSILFPDNQSTPDINPTNSTAKPDENNLSNQSGDGGSNSTSGNVNDPANINTGPYSSNFGQEIFETKMEELNKNLGELYNKIEALTSTGFNYSNLNTLDGTVFTGNNQTTVELLNKLNSNISGIGGFAVYNIYDTFIGDIVLEFANGSLVNAFNQASETVSRNTVTGPYSSNTAISQGEFTVKEASGNDAKIENEINLSASTGSNSASFNTGNGLIKTGNATALGNIINLANTNLNVANWLFGVVNIFGSLMGNIILPQENQSSSQTGTNSNVVVGNSYTGPFSTNNASYESEEVSTFETANTAEVVSQLNVEANTGNNVASINTGGGFVSSGKADATVSNSTIANTNTVDEEGTVWMVIVNEMGRWVGHIIGNPWGTTTASNALPITTQTGGFGEQTFTTAENSVTGPYSENEAEITQKKEETYKTQNSAIIENKINASADTGNNQAIYNTGAGAVQTGDADVGLNLVNMVNTNVIAKKFVAVLVNVIGDFLGDIIPTGSQVVNSGNSINNNQINLGGLPEADELQPLPTLVPVSEQISNNNTVLSDDAYQQSTENTLPQANNYENPNGNNLTDYYDTDDYLIYLNSQETVQQQRRKIQYLKKMYQQGVVVDDKLSNNKLIKRGIFVSPNFIKAVETTYPGILLGGWSFKVNNSWLSVIPLGLIIVILRRRKKIDMYKYLNNILEIIL